MKLWQGALIVLILISGILNKKIKNKKNPKDDHLVENKELYEFHKINDIHKKELKGSKVDIADHPYKDITEENYEKRGMGYHSDYSPIDENR